jgi:TolB-like protein/Flp pilus assembly protein TadD
MPEPIRAPGAVFLSYASQDAAAAKRICEALRAAGVEVWFDTDGGLEHGDEWDAKIRRQIKECVLFLAVVSANTQAREEGYFRIEWELATDRAMGIASGVAFILPIVIDDTRESDALVPDRFRKVQWTKLPGGAVPPEVRDRFLKLWSHRTGVLKHQADGGRGRPVPPQGDRAGSGDPALQKKQSFRLAWIAGALFAAALAVGGYFWVKRSTTPGSIPANADTGTRPPVAEKSALAADDKSVAVLAFANLSEEKGNEFFSDSISEELLNVLAKVPGLKVSARTSAFHFKGKDTPIPEIAKQLGVAYVVEGSVRKSGDKVRITAQLIKAADGFHVWSDTFTRDLKDIFAVQDEIAGLIAQNLELKLGLATRKPVAINPDAYQLYIEARQAWGMRDKVHLDRAEELLKRVIALQPDFARAYAAMGNVMASRSDENDLEPGSQRYRELNEQALNWADRALALDPDLAEAYGTKGNAYDRLGRATEARAAFRKSIELDPNYASGHQWYGRNLSEDGYLDEALGEIRRAVELDPLAPRILDNYATFLNTVGRREEALVQIERALAVQPGSLQAQAFKASILNDLGRSREAVDLTETLLRRPDHVEFSHLELAPVLISAGRRAEVESWLQADPPIRGFGRGILLCMLGRVEEAIPLLKPEASYQRDILLWTAGPYLPVDSPEFLRRLTEWGMKDAFDRAEAWRAKNQPRAAATTPVDQKSVAVLAFANLSDDKGNEYFSDGISEELLNVLAKVPGLKVTARTSSFHFKGKDTPIPEIARQLGVAYVIEGSVRKAGNKVRITAQLIKAADGFHVWSEDFDRELKDVFAIQDEIAGLVARNLQLKLGAPARSAGPADPEAYQFYLQGRQALQLRTVVGYDEAEKWFSRSKAIAPSWAPVYAALADAARLRTFGSVGDSTGPDRPWPPGLQQAKAFAEQALALDHDLPEAYVALSGTYMLAWNFTESERLVHRALELNPNEAAAYLVLGRLCAAQGRMDESIAAFRRGVELNPLAPRILDNLAAELNFAGRYEEGWNVIQRAAALQPDGAQIQCYQARLLASLGRREEALRMAEKLLKNPEVAEAHMLHIEAAAVFSRFGRQAEAEALVAQLPADAATRAVGLAYIGHADAAAAELDRINFGWIEDVLWGSSFDPIRQDPRLVALMRRVGLVEAQARATAWRAAHAVGPAPKP